MTISESIREIIRSRGIDETVTAGDVLSLPRNAVALVESGRIEIVAVGHPSEVLYVLEPGAVFNLFEFMSDLEGSTIPQPYQLLGGGANYKVIGARAVLDHFRDLPSRLSSKMISKIRVFRSELGNVHHETLLNLVRLAFEQTLPLRTFALLDQKTIARDIRDGVAPIRDALLGRRPGLRPCSDRAVLLELAQITNANKRLRRSEWPIVVVEPSMWDESRALIVPLSDEVELDLIDARIKGDPFFRKVQAQLIGPTRGSHLVYESDDRDFMHQKVLQNKHHRIFRENNLLSRFARLEPKR